jgi:HEPN domain-containing protein/predicted nucleotidyltransferase
MTASRQDDRITQLISALKAYDPEQIILFGSQARGKGHAYSDLDVAIIKETAERFLDRLGTVYDLLPPVGAVDVVVYTPAEFAEMKARGNPFIDEIMIHGLVIYERGVDQATLPREIQDEGAEYNVQREPTAEAERWLAQSQYELDVARHSSEGRFHAAACFYAQQAAEKALRAYLYATGERRAMGHAVQELAQRCAMKSQAFHEVLPRIKKLDRFYIPTRYPNRLPGGVPAELFDAEDAVYALASAAEALHTVRAEIKALCEN